MLQHYKGMWETLLKEIRYEKDKGEEEESER
jgi:hypothetical protein